MFYYLPLESYKERYSSIMSSPGGWIEDLLIKNKILFTRIEGRKISTSAGINRGRVLDYCGRSFYSLLQCANLVELIYSEVVKDKDIIYFEDFWTPGIEAVQYSAELMNIHLNFYTMLHAQSVDKYDFTYSLKYWMRYYEIGQSYFMRGIFVTSEYLLDLCTEAGLQNVYFGGLPYNSQYIINHYKNSSIQKEDQIIYCSRFDEEKQPLLFIELAKKLYKKYTFVMTTSCGSIKSNNSDIVKSIIKAEKEKIIQVKVGLSKQEYYEELQKSKYQFNCALQDWLSWTLLEALTFQCIPIYPKYRSFPEYLPSSYLYEAFNIDEAVRIIRNNSYFNIELLKIVEYFDCSFSRYLSIMKGNSSGE